MIRLMAAAAAAAYFAAAWGANVSVFFVIDTQAQSKSVRFHEVMRRTWIRDIRPPHDYRFFFFEPNTSAWRSWRCSKCVLVPKRLWHPNRHPREHRFSTFALRWALEHALASHVVTCSDDVYVCVHHLAHDLGRRWPREGLFVGHFWRRPRPMCRAEKFLQIYSRDVLRDALDHHDRIDPFFQRDGGHFALNWDRTWGQRAQVMWQKAELAVVHEPVLDSELAHHLAFENLSRAFNDTAFYCARHLAMHAWPNEDSRLFYFLHTNTRRLHRALQNGTFAYDRDDEDDDSPHGPSPPPCYLMWPICDALNTTPTNDPALMPFRLPAGTCTLRTCAPPTRCDYRWKADTPPSRSHYFPTIVRPGPGHYRRGYRARNSSSTPRGGPGRNASALAPRDRWIVPTWGTIRTATTAMPPAQPLAQENTSSSKKTVSSPRPFFPMAQKKQRSATYARAQLRLRTQQQQKQQRRPKPQQRVARR